MGDTVSVSSVVYNLAGDIAKRPDYLKTLVIGNVIADNEFSITDTISAGYLYGPGIKLRNFARWADSSGYNALMGFLNAKVNIGDSIDQDVIATRIPVDPGEVALVQTADINFNAVARFSEPYVYENYPALWDAAWVASLLSNGDIEILFPDTSTATFTPTPAFDPNARYLNVRYVTATPDVEGPLVEGTPVTVAVGDPYPDMTGWTEVHDDTPTPSVLVLTETVDVLITYSDGRPDETSHTETPRDEIYDKIEGEYTRTVGLPSVPPEINQQKQWEYHIQIAEAVDLAPVVVEEDEEIEPGVFKHTTTTILDQELNLIREYRIDTQDVTLSSRSAIKGFNYKYQSGDAVLDAMFNPEEDKGQFFPYIPFRIDNVPVTEATTPIIYPSAKTAFRKAVNGRFDKTILDIQDNDDIEDIDFIYGMFGVSLNTLEDASKEYIYRLFQFMLSSTYEDAAYLAFKAETVAYKAATDAYNAWQIIQEDGPEDDPLYGTPPPVVPKVPVMPTRGIHIASGDLPIMNFNMIISWAAMSETTGIGQKIPGAKRGQLWWDALSDEVFPEIVFNGTYVETGDIRVQRVILNWQETDNSWRSLAFWDLYHANNVYNGNVIVTRAVEALIDAEESGFIVPLHVDLYKQMSIVKSTQMSTACCYMVFNCYTINKQKWYQTGLFQVLVVVVIAIVSVFTGGASAGLLGTSLGVGTSLGFTGTLAIIVGAVANAVAAMILTQIITSASTQLFGEKIGGIIGTIASMVAINVGTSVATGGSALDGFSNLMKADNLLKLTESVGKGVVGYINQATMDIQKETEQYVKEAELMQKQVDQAYSDNIGYDRAVIDPTSFTDAATQMGFRPESLDSFLGRTLMTGSEIAEMSQTLLTNFTQVTLNLDLRV